MAKADTNGDGHIRKEEYEMELEFKRKAFEDADARRDAMRQMAWFALFRHVTLFFCCSFSKFNWFRSAAGKNFGDMAATYFVLAAIVMAFIAGNAYNDAKKK